MLARHVKTRTLAVAAVAAMLLVGAAAQAADYTAKLAYVAQPSNPFHTAMEYFAEKVAEKTGGALPG
jgi:TRAP-type C4-dicarboxylate transport system substrate-binding protein